MPLTKSHVPRCGPLIASRLRMRNPRRGHCFIVLLDFLALKVRPMESCVIARVFDWDFMPEFFYRQVRFSPCIVSAYSSMIQEQLYPLFDG